MTATAGTISVKATSTRTVVTSATSTAGGADPSTPNPEVQADSQGKAKTSKGPIGVAGALAVNDVKGNTQAYVATGTLTSSGGPINIASTSANTSTTNADGSPTSSGTSSGVGVAVAVNIVNVDNKAYVDGTTVLTSPAVTVQAAMPSASSSNTFNAIAKSGAGNPTNVGLAGAVAVNVVSNTSEALLNATGALTLVLPPSNVGPDISFSALNNATNTASATATTGGGSTGVGASVAVNVATNTADARILDGASLTGTRNLSLTATSNDPATTTVTAGAAATSGTGVGASAAIGVVNSESSATIGTSAGTLTTSGFVMMSATHTGSSNTSADASAAGSKAAIGAAVAVNVESETSTATTKRSINAGGYVTIMADNAGAGTADAKAGAQGADAAASSADAPKTGEASTADNQVGDQLDLASSEAPSDPDAANAKTAKPSAKTSKGQLNVAGAIGVNVETSSAQASIPNGLTITATGLLTVHTSNDTDGLAKGDGSATAGANTSSTSVGVGIAINYVRRPTRRPSATAPLPARV